MIRLVRLATQGTLGAALVLGLTGCSSASPLVKLVNDLVPPVTPIDNQNASVAASQAQLRNLTSPALYAAFSVNDLRRLLEPAIEASLKNPASTLEVHASNLHMDLGPQEVIVHMGFSVTMDPEQSRYEGTATVHCSPATQDGGLVILPSATQLHFTKFMYKGKKSTELLKPLINATLKMFINNLNGRIAAQRLPLEVTAMQSFDVKKALQGIKGAEDASGTSGDVTVGAGYSAVLVDPSGIRVLAELVTLTPRRLKTAFDELEQRLAKKDTSPYTSAQIATIGSCRDGATLARIIGGDPEQVKQACENLREALAKLPPTVHAEPKEAYDKLAGTYGLFTDAFFVRVDQVEPRLSTKRDHSIVAVSRARVAEGLNEITAGVGGSVTLRLDHIAVDIPEQVFAPTTTNLHCHDNPAPCPDFAFRPYERGGCRSDCTIRKSYLGIPFDTVDLACVWEKTACEGRRETERLAYEAEKAAAQVRWKTERIACEFRKAAQIAGCDINQGWLDRWAHPLGRSKGWIHVDDTTGHLAADSFHVDGAFDAISLRLMVWGSTNISALLRVEPLNEGYLVCIKPLDVTLKAKATLVPTTKTLGAKLASTRTTDKGVELEYRMPKQDIEVVSDPPIEAALYQQNAGKLLLNCPVPALLAGQILGDAAPLHIGLQIGTGLIPGKRTVPVPERSFTLTVPRQELHIEPDRKLDKKTQVRIENHTLRLFPRYGTEALIFEGQ